MGLRKTILATGEYYHILNRSIQGIPIFKGKRENILFLEAMEYYLQPSPPTRFSIYRVGIEKYQINLKKPLVSIINFCLMPNHFHFTLRQEKESGIRKFIQRLTNSFAHYFNIKYKNRGPLFEGNFKAVRIETDEQLIHLSRYIHLNALKTQSSINFVDFSSYPYYLGLKHASWIKPEEILGYFKTSQRQDLKDFLSYQGFVEDYSEDAREILESLTLEDDF